MAEVNYQIIVAKQRHFFHSGETREIAFRIEQLKKLQIMIENNELAITEALYKDLGKSSAESIINEIALTIEEIKHAIKHLKKWSQKVKVPSPLPLHWTGTSEIHYEPYGCTLIIAPWNYPFLLLIFPLIGAMSAGNCVILKPSEIAAHTENLILQLIENYFPPEYICAITANTSEVYQLLQVKFDYIFFTGSTAVGKIIMSEAAKQMTPVTLELGGKTPCILDQTANYQFAARRIIWAKMMNAGQTCVAPDYVYVPQSCRDLLVKELIKVLNKFYGNREQSHADLGRIINQHHFDRLTHLMHETSILFGGQTNAKERYIAPTLVDGVSWDHPIMKEEIFGPILPILVYDHIDEVLQIMQTKAKPLALYLFSNNKETQKKILRQLSFGGGCINDCLLQILNPHLPFGGVGASGIGMYHGKYSFETFSHRKSIYKKCMALDFKLEYPPFNNNKLKWLRKLIKLSYRWL